MIAIRFFAMAHVTLAELVTFENCCKYLEIEFQQDWHKRFNQYFERNGNIYENDDLVLENLLTKIRRREVSFDQSMSPYVLKLLILTVVFNLITFMPRYLAEMPSKILLLLEPQMLTWQKMTKKGHSC